MDASVASASVLGILVEGGKLTTYAMDMKSNIYRMMVQLGDFELIQKQVI
ncbi:hypothetical protein MUCCIDRAFT_107224 [Mucor lusitanicus CBS 277.49]|uniref:Uncharacterized protein n=2 Tax=Mucor circinelloides f. lusitanicus TaxID=29924 RepID=A0A168NRV5_MUCCL|nr:hypothetical protein MUCCIDRAFT_107224 [Mucor lusitanicus CBS 277.49]